MASFLRRRMGNLLEPNEADDLVLADRTGAPGDGASCAA
jgi:hypothetical protein